MKLAATMKLAVPLALALTTSLAAQTVFADPANLSGERVRPRDGRELPIDQGARGLEQLLRRLNTRASLMLIVAHPDDEDGGMLTFVSRGLGARVATLTLTRGEGGQNAMTGDFEDALGLLRTQELLSADRYLGVDQFFGTEVDFGFSKTKEEAFGKWTHDRALYDAVRAIRIYRPLVIAAVFIGGVTDGHGHHQVSGQIAQEAFKAAADPNFFPDMVREGILPWQAQKVYARVPMQAITPQGLYDYATGQYTPARFTNYVTGEVTTKTPSADVIVHEGQIDPLLSDDTGQPRSYVQFARMGLGLQKSQIGPGVRLASSGRFDIAYHLYGSKFVSRTVTAHEEGDGHPLAPATFFDGIDTSFTGIATLAPGAPEWLPKELYILSEEVKEAIKWNSDAATRKGVPDLLADMLKRVDFLLPEIGKAAMPQMEKVNLLHELRVKRVQLNDALALALGVTMDAVTDHADHALETPLIVSTTLSAATPEGVTLLGSGLRRGDSDTTIVSSPVPAQSFSPSSVQTLVVPAAYITQATRPYFSRDNIETPVYALLTPALRNAPQTPPALSAFARLQYGGARFEVGRVVHAGDQAVAFVPPVSVTFSQRAGMIALDNKEPMVWAETLIPLTPCIAPEVDTEGCRKFAEESTVSLRLSPGWSVARITPVLSPQARELRQYEGFTLTPPPLKPGDLLSADAVMTWRGKEYAESYRSIGYGNLPRTNLFKKPTYRAVAVDLKMGSHPSIGYIEGTGDEVFDVLFALTGGHADRLGIADVTPVNLKRFDAVVLGVRTYNAHPGLHGAPTQALLDYARSGGTVLVQYQTPEFTSADAPYPLELGSNEKVVDESAPVQLLSSDNALLTTPNRIGAADFAGWVEERGHGFLSSWDPRYTALTETHDPGSDAEHVQPQEPQRGGLITTRLGKGRWTYCAFALYRQMPEANPGAFRLFTNLITP